MMDVEITKQRETPLLGRTRVSAMTFFEDKTPSRMELQKAIASKVKKDANHVIIMHIYQRYGKREAKIIAHVYNDDKLIEKLEGKKLIAKNKEKKEGEAKEEKKE